MSSSSHLISYFNIHSEWLSLQEIIWSGAQTLTPYPRLSSSSALSPLFCQTLRFCLLRSHYRSNYGLHDRARSRSDSSACVSSPRLRFFSLLEAPSRGWTELFYSQSHYIAFSSSAPPTGSSTVACFRESLTSTIWTRQTFPRKWLTPTWP